MTTVDERVVEMRFDNKQFGDGIQSSLKSIDNLKKGLNLDESVKSLSNLEKAGKSFSLANLATGVETISGKFTALGIVGVTALQNITNSAIATGKRLMSALTIDPIKTGFSEYETQINAVQTILANTSGKGTKIDQVNAALNELNTYADKTIYNFTEMTRNIGTFTAAGVELDTSVQAIKGIANLAAVSGSTSQQASTAMYQLSQALAAGTVKLQDWNSVVNAGMGGQVFQDALKETARVHGVAIDKMIKNEGSFRETLSKGWLTSEILTETLSKFTGDLNEEQLKTMGYTEEQIKSIMAMGKTANDAATKVKTFTQLWDTLKEAAQSGWSQSWQTIVGDFEEAKVLLTEVSDTLGAMIGASADARNEMLTGWKSLGGRTSMIEAVRNAFEGVLSVIKPVKEAFSDIFPPTTAEQLYNITEGLRKLTEKFKMGETTSENLKRTFKGLFAVLDIGRQLITAFFGGFAQAVGYITPAADGLLGFTATLGDWLVGVNEAVKTGDVFNKAFAKVGEVVGPILVKVKDGIDKVIEGIKSFKNVDMSGVDEFGEKVKTRFAPFATLGTIIKNAFGFITGVLQKAAPVFLTLGEIIGKAFKKITDAIAGADFETLGDIFNSGVLAAVMLGIKKFIDSLSDFTGGASDMLGGITGILDGVKGSLEAWQGSIKAGTLMKIAGAVAILAAALIALSFIDTNKLTGALAAISVLFVELFGSMAVFEKVVGSEGFASMGKVTTAMVGLSIAVLVLSTAVEKLSGLSWEDLTKGLSGVAILCAVMVASAKSLSKSSGKLIKGSVGLVVFAAAIRVLVESVEALGVLDTQSLIKGLVGVGVLCAELALFLKVTDLSGMGMTKGVGLIALAAAIRILASAVGVFGELDVSSLIKGLAGVGVVLTELALFIKMTGDAKKVISTAVGMTILGAAMLIFGSAIEKMGVLSWETIGKGLLTMAGALAAVTVAVNLMPKGMVSKAVGMIGVAAALLILADALSSMGSMSWLEIAKGLATLAGSMLILAVGLNAMNGALPGAAALLVCAGALAIFVPILKTLGEMSLVEIGIGLLALAGVFTVFGVAGLVLTPLTPILLALGAAITLFGVGCLAVGAGVLAFAAGLSALAVAGTAGAAALVLIVTSLIGLIPMVIEQIGVGLIALCTVIAEGAPAIMEAVAAVLLSIIEALVKVTPPLIEAVVVLIETLLRTLADHVPAIVQAGFDMLLGFLKGVRDNIKEIVTVAADIVINFIDGIGEKLPDLIQAGFDLIIDFIDGLGEAIKENTPRLVDSFLGLGGNVIQGLVDGLFAGIKKVKDTIVDVGKSMLNGIKDFLGIHSPSKEFELIGNYTTEGLANGIKDKSIVQKAKDAILGVGEAILGGIKGFFGIQSPSRLMRDEVGNYVVQGIAEGIKKDTSAEEAARIKAQNIVSAFKTELDKLDLDVTTFDLENKLFNSKNPNTSSVDKIGKDMDLVQSKIKIQNDKISLAQGEYQVTVKTFGESSEEAQQAYNKFLQEQVSLAELQTQLVTSQEALEQAERDRISSISDTADLEYQLWEKLNGATATQAQKANAQMQLISGKVINQAREVDKAQADFQEALLTFGQNSQEAQTAYNNYLQTQIQLADLTSQLTAAQQNEAARQRDSAKAYFNYLRENSANLKEMGFTTEEIQKAAMADSGYDPNAMAQNMAVDVKDAVVGAMGTVQTVYADNAESTLGTLVTNFSTFGTSYAQALGTGLQNGAPQLIESAKVMTDSCAQSIKGNQAAWVESGSYLVQGFVQGIQSQIQSAADSAAAMAAAALAAAKKTFDINSPSRAFAELGMYADMGLAKGLTEYANVAAKAAADVGGKAISNLGATIGRISDALDGNMDLAPTIRPVLDMTEIARGGKLLGGLLMPDGLRVDGVAAKASAAVSTADRGEAAPQSVKQSSDQQFSFVQNNYSPKPLSRLEIYRSTKNQFSALKGLVTGK